MIFEFTKEQRELLIKMDIPFDPFGELTDDELFELEDIVSDYLQMHGLAGPPNYINDIGELCGDIMTSLARQGDAYEEQEKDAERKR